MQWGGIVHGLSVESTGAEEDGGVPPWEGRVLAEASRVVEGFAHIATEGAVEAGWAVDQDIALRVDNVEPVAVENVIICGGVDVQYTWKVANLLFRSTMVIPVTRMEARM